MATPEEFEERYIKGQLPWDTGEPDRHLMDVISENAIAPCRMLELGAGTATDAIWLAGLGFDVTAVDVSPTALDMARKKSAESGVKVNFVLADLMKDKLSMQAFSFVYDRGCFHVFESPHQRADLVEKVWHHMASDGLWFSLIGSTDGRASKEGPPRRSALDIAAAVEYRFEILSLTAVTFDTQLSEDPRAWACLMRKRVL